MYKYTSHTVMSEFKLKSKRNKKTDVSYSLDEIHQDHMISFDKKQLSLPKKQAKLDKLKNELDKINKKPSKFYTNDDIRKRSSVQTEIQKLQDEIYDIQNNVCEMDYYRKTLNLLMDYYETNDYGKIDDNSEPIEKKKIKHKETDILDRLNTADKKVVTVKKVPKKRKKVETVNNSTDITTFFGCSVVEPKKTNKADLYNKYISYIDSGYDINFNIKNTKQCTNCNIDKIVIASEGICVCEKCGDTEMIIVESERPNYKDHVPDKPGYPYKRINHYNEWLSQFQAKESTEIPKEVYNLIIQELNKNRFYDFKQLTIPYIKKILKKLELTKYYEHATHIISKLTGLPPPSISREAEDQLRVMFKHIQVPFENHRPPDRLNFLSYSYVLHKFCQLLELDDFIKYFPLLKSRDKLRQQDKIWQNICKDLQWEYIPSI